MSIFLARARSAPPTATLLRAADDGGHSRPAMGGTLDNDRRERLVAGASGALISDLPDPFGRATEAVAPDPTPPVQRQPGAVPGATSRGRQRAVMSERWRKHC